MDSAVAAAARSTSRRRCSTALELIGESARAARSLTGYLDHADGEPYWRPPRSERSRRAGHASSGRSDAPADTVSRGLELLGEHRRDLPTQAFVFVLSDFLVPPDERAWQRALEHRWELVPVVIQDPVWERTFPDVGGVTVPYADPATGGVVPVYLTRAEAARLRERARGALGGARPRLPLARDRAGRGGRRTTRRRCSARSCAGPTCAMMSRGAVA